VTIRRTEPGFVRPVLAVGLVLLAAVFAFADDKALPYNPFTSAIKGDWSVCTGTMSLVPAGKSEGRTERATFVVRILEAERWTVKVGLTQTVAGIALAEQRAALDPHESLSVESFLNLNDAGGPPADAVVASIETRTAAGRGFACRKVTCHMDVRGTKETVSLWLSPEVRGWGLVALSIAGVTKDGGKLSIEVELAGYGNDKRTDWGKRPEELEPRKPDPPDPK
jgi:hypothetical protein